MNYQQPQVSTLTLSHLLTDCHSPLKDRERKVSHMLTPDYILYSVWKGYHLSRLHVLPHMLRYWQCPKISRKDIIIEMRSYLLTP